MLAHPSARKHVRKDIPLLRDGGIMGGGLAINRCIVPVGDAPASVGLYKYFCQDIAAVEIGRAAGPRPRRPQPG